METLDQIKSIVESMEVDTKKVYKNGNVSASIRARRYAQEIKELIPLFRKEILAEVKRHRDE